MTTKKKTGRPPIPDSQIVIVRVDGDTHRKAMKLALKTGVSMSEMVRRGLRYIVSPPADLLRK